MIYRICENVPCANCATSYFYFTDLVCSVVMVWSFIFNRMASDKSSSSMFHSVFTNHACEVYIHFLTAVCDERNKIAVNFPHRQGRGHKS